MVMCAVLPMATYYLGFIRLLDSLAAFASRLQLLVATSEL